MSAPEVPFSDLQLHARETVARLKATRGRSLRLRRRDDDDLMLTTASRAEQEHAMVSAATRMFVALMQRDDGARLLAEVAPVAFPWVRFLPDDEVHEFAAELVRTLEASDAVENPAPVVQVIGAWQSTAEVYADPNLAEVLATDGADYGPVPSPG